MGSPENKYKREQVERLEAELKRIRKQLALLNFELEDADENDAAAIAQAQAKFDAAEQTFNTAQDRMNQLLGRNR